MSIIFKEKINITPDALTEVISGCNQDVRQVLHHLSLIKARENSVKMTGAEAKREADRSKKTSIKVVSPLATLSCPLNLKNIFRIQRF